MFDFVMLSIVYLQAASYSIPGCRLSVHFRFRFRAIKKFVFEPRSVDYRYMSVPSSTPQQQPLGSPVLPMSPHPSGLSPKEAGWRPPPPMEREPECWSPAQAHHVARTLREADRDPEFAGRFRRLHVADLADDVTAYAVAVEVVQARPDYEPLRAIDFGRLFHRLAGRVRSALGADRYGGAVVNEVRGRLQSVPGIPLQIEPVIRQLSARRKRGRTRSTPSYTPPNSSSSYSAYSASGGSRSTQRSRGRGGGRRGNGR